MRFIKRRGPSDGDKRIVKAFAWLPVRMRYGANETEYVWLESYWRQEVFRVFCSSSGAAVGSWINIAKLFKEEYEQQT